LLIPSGENVGSRILLSYKNLSAPWNSLKAINYRNGEKMMKLFKRFSFKRLIIILIALISLCSCKRDKFDIPKNIDFRQEMRDFVIGISKYCESKKPGFIIIPQNGIELVTTDGKENSPLDSAYLEAIDGHGQEDLFYGYINDDEATPVEDNSYIRSFLDRSKNGGKTILVTDYCSIHSKMDDSYNQNHSAGYISFAASHRNLDNIPDYPASIYSENNNEVSDLPEVQNFLYLIDYENYTTKSDFIHDVTATNYDLLIMDYFFDVNVGFTTEEIDQLRNKANGGKRLVVSYISVGEAEDYRYYWQSSWFSHKPSWLGPENPDWQGNDRVKYWEKTWQDIIYGNDNSYMKKILDAGFDGAYLDIIDAFDYYLP
jgi:cysteinyl-tRNA synthetase